VPSTFADLVSTDPARPLLTWYDNATGERTELSGATLANWVAKTANLLVDGCGLGVGDVAAVRTPPHWQTAAIMLSVWTAGLAVTHSPDAAGDVAFVLPGTPATAADTFVVGLHPFALPVRDLEENVLDWVSSARVHGDHYGGPPAPGDAAALVDLPRGASIVTQSDLAVHGLRRAGELGIAAGTRILISVDAHPGPLDWLVAPIMTGCTLVLCANADHVTLDKWAAVERAQRV
jgi:uncharacterized protein (TIGR03089 family)